MKNIRTVIASIIKERIVDDKKVNCMPIKITQEVVDEVKKFNTLEDLLRHGGISIDALDRMAYGFSENDIKTLMPSQLNIKWHEDLENVKYEISFLQKKHSNKKMSEVMKMWAKNIDLKSPIDVCYEKNKFYIEDGHHRYYAAKILNKPLNVKLEIKMNPIDKLSTSLSYDDFHRCVFEQVKNIVSQKL